MLKARHVTHTHNPSHGMRRQEHHLFHFLGVAAISLEDQVACRESFFPTVSIERGGAEGGCVYIKGRIAQHDSNNRMRSVKETLYLMRSCAMMRRHEGGNMEITSLWLFGFLSLFGSAARMARDSCI